MQEYFEVGQIVNTFGIKGLLKVKPFTDENSRFEELKKVYIDRKGKLQEAQIENVSYHKEMVLLKVKGIDDPAGNNRAPNCLGRILQRKITFLNHLGHRFKAKKRGNEKSESNDPARNAQLNRSL